MTGGGGRGYHAVYGSGLPAPYTAVLTSI